MADTSVMPPPVPSAGPSFASGGSGSFQPRHQFTPRSQLDHGPRGDGFGLPRQHSYRPRYHHKFQNRFKSADGGDDASGLSYDGKRMRKAIHRKTVDYNPSVFKYLQNRVWQRDRRDQHLIQPDSLYIPDLLPPSALMEKPMNCVTTRFVRTSTNKFRCPIFCLSWTPEGRRLVTGASSGEFTLWNGLTFNFETILQAHETAVRAMRWSHSDLWMVTADHAGYIKYWQSNMNNVKMYAGHKEPVRGISFCPSDSKFASCSDDGTVRVWDFMHCHEERILRGHGADVRCVDWHPQKGLIASGSKDNQQPIKLWEPRSGTSLATIHAHKHTVMDLKWHQNGNWMLTASRDHLVKLFDIRNLKEEMQTFKGHKREATAIAWHPIHESLFASGSADGALMFWMVGCDHEVGSMEEAHEGMVWDLSWHPLGHILASGSNDHTTKFWTRNRPGDEMRDKYNLNNLPQGMMETEILEYQCEPLAMPTLPGMGLEHGLPDHLVKKEDVKEDDGLPAIPGLDWEADEAFLRAEERAASKKVPYARPVPKVFEQAWTGEIDVDAIKKEQQEKQVKQHHHHQQQQQHIQHLKKGMPNFIRPNQPALLLAQLGAALAGSLRQSMSISEAARMLIPGAPVLMRPNAPRVILTPSQSMMGQQPGGGGGGGGSGGGGGPPRMFMMPGGMPPRNVGPAGQQQLPQEPSSMGDGSQADGSGQAGNVNPSNSLGGGASSQQQQQQQNANMMMMMPNNNNQQGPAGQMRNNMPGVPQNQRPVRPQQGQGGQNQMMNQFPNQNNNTMGGFQGQQGQMVRPQGQMGGPPQGQMGGPPQGQMGGPPQGQMGRPQGQMGGPQGQMGGPPQGQMGGPPQGQMGGPPQGQMGGPPQGQMGGPPQGQMGGPPQGQMGGPPQGQMGGPPQGQMGGPPQGQMGGPPQGQMGGPPQGQMGGPPQGQMGGPPQGQMGGPPQGQMGGPPQGQMAGPPQGQMGGPPQGQMNQNQQGPHQFGQGHQGQASNQGQGYGVDQSYDQDDRMQGKRNSVSMRVPPGGPEHQQQQEQYDQNDPKYYHQQQYGQPPTSGAGDHEVMGDYDYRQPPGSSGAGRHNQQQQQQQQQQRYYNNQGGGGGYGNEGDEGGGAGEDYHQQDWGGGKEGGDYDYRYSGGGGGDGGRGGGGRHAQRGGGRGGFNQGGWDKGQGGRDDRNEYEDYGDGEENYSGGGGSYEDYGYEDHDDRGDSRGGGGGGRGRKRAWGEDGPGGGGGRGRGRGSWGGRGGGGRGEFRGGGGRGFRGGNRGPGRGVRGGRGRGTDRGRGRGGY